jgi:hypothetical protein
MQVAINPNIYGSAQMYAERKGLNLVTEIENFLVQFVDSAKEQVSVNKKQQIEITPKVASLRTGHSWDISDDDLDKVRYEYLMEKYK